MKRIFGLCLLLCTAALAEQLPFPVGEELVYSISWNGIPIAYSEISTSMEKFEGKEVLAIRMQSRTYPFFNWFFKANDRHESFVDPKTLLPVQFTKNLREGGYRCHEITRFDHAAGRAHYEHQTNGSKKSYDIEPDTRDILSFLYFMRGRLLEPDTTTQYRLMADEKIYNMIIRSTEVEEIDLPHYPRSVPSLRIEPEAKFDGLFVRKGKATMWISRDERRLLTFLKASVPFGKVRIELQEVRGPGNDFWITELEKEDDD